MYNVQRPDHHQFSHNITSTVPVPYVPGTKCSYITVPVQYGTVPAQHVYARLRTVRTYVEPASVPVLARCFNWHVPTVQYWYRYRYLVPVPHITPHNMSEIQITTVPTTVLDTVSPLYFPSIGLAYHHSVITTSQKILL